MKWHYNHKYCSFIEYVRAHTNARQFHEHTHTQRNATAKSALDIPTALRKTRFCSFNKIISSLIM